MKLNSAVEHHLTILCQGWGKNKGLVGGGWEKEKEKKKRKILPQHLSVTVAFRTGDREAVARSRQTGGGGSVCLCPKNGDRRMVDERSRVSLSTSHRATRDGRRLVAAP